MKKQARPSLWLPGMVLLIAFCIVATNPGVSRGAADEIVVGVAASNIFIDMGAVTASTFLDSAGGPFANSGDASPSIIMAGGDSGGVQIGAIYFNATAIGAGSWKDTRIIFDINSNGDGTFGDGSFDAFDWSANTNPWNIADGYTDYPAGYPCDQDSNCTSTTGGNNGLGTGANFPWDTFQWWFWESQEDMVWYGYEMAGALMNWWWDGRDMDWKVLPNGNYSVKIEIDEDGDGLYGAADTPDEANSTIVIAIDSVSISGTVVDSDTLPIDGARVEASSWAGWGDAWTDSNGEFSISGLQADADYWIRAQAEGKTTAETNVVVAADGNHDTLTITLSDAVYITGTLKLDTDMDGTPGEDPDDAFSGFTNQWGWTQNDLWVWVDAWNMQGPGWGNTDVQFLDCTEYSCSATEDTSITFTIGIPPAPDGETYTYQLNVHIEGYALSSDSPTTVEVTSSGGTVSGDLVLEKASILQGTVQLPAGEEVGVNEWVHIDAQAISTTDSDVRYWGWGQIDPWQDDSGNWLDTPVAADSGRFRFDGIAAGTYNLELRVWGYQTATVEDVVIAPGVDKNLLTDPIGATGDAYGAIEVGLGAKITGTLTVQGDSSAVETCYGCGDSGDLHVWVDVWSPTGGGWGGTNVTLTRGTNASATYTIGGLTTGHTYEIHSWLGENYELVSDPGLTFPVQVDLTTSPVTQNIRLRPYQGIVQGTITGPGGLDLNSVVVEVKRPWDWMPPQTATVANGKINASTGAYSVEGLGTGDYVVRAGMYSGWYNWSGTLSEDMTQYTGEGMLVPSSTVGASVQRVFVENDSTSPTTADIAFEQGYSISGTFTISSDDPPIQGTDTVTIDHVCGTGQMIKAMSKEMMFMGDQESAMVGAFSSLDPGAGTAQYTINGLAPGVYVVMPPFNSFTLGTASYTGEFFNGGESEHHWTAAPQHVVVGPSEINPTGNATADFTIANGQTITGTLTLPDSPSSNTDWGGWCTWVGHLELETPGSRFFGHGTPLFSDSFSGSRYDFTFNHVANGDYVVRFWSDRYVPGSSSVITVSNVDASTSLTIEAGANLTGMLIDDATGEAVTGVDGVTVMCEAIPWVEGSWRETRGNDMWSTSYIETGNTSSTQGVTSGDASRDNNTPGKFHLTALPTGYTYIVIIQTQSHGEKTSGAKNYVGKIIAGIEVPAGATGNIDIGTIRLVEGITIKGLLTDSHGDGIGGVDVAAMPSDTHDGTAEARGMSDADGNYTVYGIDPNVTYYDLIAAEKSSMFDDWGRRVQWGERYAYNVQPSETDSSTGRTVGADFTLAQATSTLTGTITIPTGSTFEMPFDDAEDFPVCHILLQRKGVLVKDMMDGIEGMSSPTPEGVLTASYTIRDLEPGDYKMLVMNYGLPTIEDEVTVAEGTTTKNVTWTSAGYTMSGSVRLSTDDGGGYPSTSDISGVVCMDAANQNITFGRLTQQADNTYSAYTVPGLASGSTYQLAFYKDGGRDGTPDIYTAGSAQTVTTDISYDATLSRNTVPILMVQAVKASGTVINVAIFSTSYLVDDSVDAGTPALDSTAGLLGVTTGNGTLSSVSLSGDKRQISATYTVGAGDSDVTLNLAVHYGDDATLLTYTVDSQPVLPSFIFNVNNITNSSVVNTYMAGQVKLGNGDPAQIGVPAGAFETGTCSDTTYVTKATCETASKTWTPSSVAKVNVTVEKDESGAALAALLGRAPMSEAEAAKRGVFARAVLTALPTDVTAAGDLYDFSASAANVGDAVDQKAAVTVLIPYTAGTDTDNLYIYHLVDGASSWTKEETSRVIDTDNNTITAEVTSLSPFLAAVASDDSSSSSSSSSSGSGGGSCFIDSAASGPVTPLAGMAQVAIMVTLVAAALVGRFTGRKLN